MGIKLQNNNITNIDSLKLFFDGCNTDFYDEDFLYYDADNVLHGRVLLYGNKIPESSFRNAASRYILNYPVTKDGKLIGVTWLEAQQPVRMKITAQVTIIMIITIQQILEKLYSLMMETGIML